MKVVVVPVTDLMSLGKQWICCDHLTSKGENADDGLILTRWLEEGKPDFIVDVPLDMLIVDPINNRYPEVSRSWDSFKRENLELAITVPEYHLLIAEGKLVRETPVTEVTEDETVEESDVANEGGQS